MPELLFADDAQKTYKKSNILIGSKYKSTLLENKLLAISLSMLDLDKLCVEDDVLVQRIRAKDLQNLMDIKGKSFYSHLDAAAQSLTGKTVGYSDGEKFDYIAIIIRSSYENGVFTLKYNPDIKDYILNLKSNYTVLNLEQTMKFRRSVYSFRIYELLRSKAYYRKGEQKSPNKVFDIYYNLSELKLAIGVINADEDKVQKILRNSKHPDFEKAEEVSTQKVLTDWRSFKRTALDKSIEEINEITELNVTYDAVKKGQGGKVCGINFHVSYKSVPKTINEDEIDKEKFLEDVSDMIDLPLKVKDLNALCRAAHYDMELLREAYGYLCDYDKPVENSVGFMIDYMKKDGYNTVSSCTQDKNGSMYLRVTD